jgi:hypothetical protein
MQYDDSASFSLKNFLFFVTNVTLCSILDGTIRSLCFFFLRNTDEPRYKKNNDSLISYLYYTITTKKKKKRGGYRLVS